MSRLPDVTPELFRDIFVVDKRGAAILEALTVLFDQPAVTDGGIDAVLKTYERMGCKRVVNYIVGQIDRANSVEPTAFEAQFD